jgi:ubiquinol-cytochrome c reductase iron-sulfur subunit
MAQDAKDGSKSSVVATRSQSSEIAGTAVISPDAIENPGFPPHRKRVTDLDPAKEKHNERVVFTLFYVSLAGSIAAVLAYMFFPIESGAADAIRLSTLAIGLSMTLSLLALGIAAVHWGKAVMADEEAVDERHPVRGDNATRQRAAEIFKEANQESGFGRRTLIRNSLIGAVIAFPLPGIVLLRSLAPQDQDPVAMLKFTKWDTGIRLARDPSGVPIKASEVTLGSVFQVIPENLYESEHYLDDKAKAIVLLVRMDPNQLTEADDKKDWSYDGIVAYSKVCTHVGCPVALYEQHTHHLLCPCHQSEFDVSDGAKVIFGPAARPLPQLPITVDEEGYLIAQSDFKEPVGPSFWERSK